MKPDWLDYSGPLCDDPAERTGHREPVRDEPTYPAASPWQFGADPEDF